MEENMRKSLDMWYGDSPHNADKIDIYFSDLDCIDRGNNYINTERGPVPVLIAEHDYIGPYPTQEARDKLDTVRGICARYNVRRELRGYYQATYIREEVAPA